MLKKARILPEPEDIETLPTDAELRFFRIYIRGIQSVHFASS